ncbi:MAG: hypothetical protein WC109_05580 [Syntrophomonadaceae bacterium]|nr:hypothetical protein [Syntrophomonadaceae bacterium]MDD4562416.1 hypothetical protein [Syntrophomonadaceae bacterium]
MENVKQFNAKKLYFSKRIIEAVYTPFSEEIKEFVLSLCIFNKFTIEQAAHMWPQSNTAALLTELLARNAFISYDGKIKTYHMHNIKSPIG